MRNRRLQPAAALVLPLLALVMLGAGSADSPLADAVKNRDMAGARALLKQHADVNAPSADGTTALHWAAKWNDAEMVTLLVAAGAKVDAVNRYGATPLWQACSNGNAPVVTALLKGGANPNQLALDGESPLMAAARGGNPEVVKALLLARADPNLKDGWKQQTALMWAVGDNEPHPQVAKALVESHADVNAKSKAGFTPLLFAARQGDMEDVRILVEAGANINDKAPGGSTILITAINNEHFEVADYLLEHGADPNAADRQGFTPLHNTIRARARSGEDSALNVIKTLVAKGANINARLPLEKMKWPQNHQVSPRPKVDEIEYGGATPFWVAANAADVKALRLLYSLGADPTILSIEKTTALMMAAGLGYGTRGPTAGLGGRIGGDDNLHAIEAVKFLVEEVKTGQGINDVNDNGQTPLHASASAAIPDVSKYLLEHGARTDLKDTFGRTPLAVAEDNRTDRYRANQNLVPAMIEMTYNVLLPATNKSSNQ